MRKRVRCIMGMLACLMALSACSLRDQTDYFAYQNRSFEATVRGEICRTSDDGYREQETDFCPGQGQTGQSWRFAARIAVQQSEASAEPTVTVTFSQPEALRGVTVTRADGHVRVSFGGMEQSDAQSSGAYDGLLRVADVLLCSVSITSVTSPERDTVEVKAASDTAEGIFYFSDGIALPRRVRWTAQGWWVDLYVDEV